MASRTSPPFSLSLFSAQPSRLPTSCNPPYLSTFSGRLALAARTRLGHGSTTSVSAVGDLSSDSTTYLIAGAAAVALLGTAFPILFSRKDICPECDGAGFIRQAGATLRANAARKDQSQIVCPRCNGLGKLGQIDK